MPTKKRPPVFVHAESRRGIVRNEPREFRRLPVVGEYLILKFDGPHYRVTAVVHCANASPMYAAELFVVEVSRAEWRRVEKGE
jgi:hypothetical protein